MDAKYLDGPNVGYCSSSEGEEDDFKVANDDDQHQANVMKRMGGPSSNTGAKGVLNDFKAFREQTKLAMEQKNQYFIEQAKRGMMMGTKEEREKAAKEEEFDLEESELDEIRRRRMQEMKKMAQNKVIEIINKNQYSDAIEASNKYLLAVLIYEPDNEECNKLTYMCKILAVDFGNVKFIRATSTLLGMSDAFKSNGVPCLQFYKNGNLIGNFVRISTALGQDGDLKKLKMFIRKQHIDLQKGGYASDSEDEDDY